MSDLQSAIWEKYQGQDLLVYGLHPQSENPQLVADFIEQTGIDYIVMPDVGFTSNTFNYAPGAGYPYPRDIVIGKDLVVRSVKRTFNVDEMDSLVEDLLAEPWP